MKTRSAVAIAALLFVSYVATAQNTPKKAGSTHLTPDQVHRSALVIDTHADTTQRLLDENYDLTQPLGGGHLNLESARKGNLGAEFFSIWVSPEQYKGHYAHRSLALIDSVHQQVAKHPDQLKLALSPEDIQTAHKEGKLAVLMGIEGGHAIEDDLGLLRNYYRLGVRYMTLTWANSNGWADSSGDYKDESIPHTKEGLTEFGKDVVYEMNRLGMMVDVSHVSDKTFYRTLVISRAPVIASHSSARAICDVPRNMTDEMLHAVNVNGGVVMVNFYSGFLSNDFRDAYAKQAPERKAAIEALKAKYVAAGKPVDNAAVEALEREWAAKIPRPPLSLLIDHIDHVAKNAGIDHVGLGTDFDGINSLPEGIDSAADLPKITAELMKRGYSAADCRKILGGNLLRVFRDVERIGHELQAQSRPRITEKEPFEKK